MSTEPALLTMPAVAVVATPQSCRGLPPWFTEALVVARATVHYGLAEALGTTIRVPRGRMGIYETPDFGLMLTTYAASGEPTLRDFYAALFEDKPTGCPLRRHLLPGAEALPALWPRPQVSTNEGRPMRPRPREEVRRRGSALSAAIPTAMARQPRCASRGRRYPPRIPTDLTAIPHGGARLRGLTNDRRHPPTTWGMPSNHRTLSPHPPSGIRPRSSQHWARQTRVKRSGTRVKTLPSSWSPVQGRPRHLIQ